MKALYRFLDSIKSNLLLFPFAILSAYIYTALVIYISFNKKLPNYIYEAVVVAVLGYFLFTALHLLKNRLYLLLGALALGGYFWYYSSIFATKYFVSQAIYLIVASILFIFVAPSIGKKSSNIELYNWTKWVTYSLSTTIILTLFSIGILFLAFGAIELLIGVKIKWRIYATGATLISGVFGANYFLEQLRAYKSFESFSDSRVQFIVSNYILPISAVAYLIILYIYTIKILTLGAWPKGGVAWFILIFTLVVIFTHFNLIPYKKEKLQKVLLIALIPQALILILAVYKRVEAYSWTESRYILTVYGVFLIFISLYLLLKREATYKVVFITAAITILFSQIGFSSGYYISKVSQTNRLKEALSAFRAGDDSYKTKEQISSSLYYLIHHYGIDGVESTFPKIVKEYKATKKPLFPSGNYSADIEYFIADRVGFEYVGKGRSYAHKDSKREQKWIYCQDKSYFKTDGYSWFLIVDGSVENNSEIIYKIDELNRLKIKMTKDKIVIKSSKEESQIDLKSYIKRLLSAKECESVEPFSYQDDRIDLRLIPKGRLHIVDEAFDSLNFILMFNLQE